MNLPTGRPNADANGAWPCFDPIRVNRERQELPAHPPFERAGGVFRVRYRTAADMDPGQQGALVEAIREASTREPVAIVFALARDVVTVDFAVPSFWIKVAGDPRIRIAGMAIVSDSLAVQIATRSFGAASRFRHVPLQVRTFSDEASALAWAQLARCAATPAYG